MCLAIPGKILSIYGEALEKIARVDFNHISKEISLAYLPLAQIGDFVIVHAGIAIALIDPKEAQQTLADLEKIKNYHEIY
jgi:hydrogenase expression/formation protein HypC